MKPDLLVRRLLIAVLVALMLLIGVQVVRATFWPAPEQVIYVVPR